MRQHALDNPFSYYAIFFLSRLMPLQVCRWLGRIIALTVYVFSIRDRRNVADNLSMALDLPAGHARIGKIVRRTFINYGEYMADFFCLPQLPPHKARDSFAFLMGEETIQKALENGRGVILVSAHIGNWEFGGLMMRQSQYSLAVVSLPHNTTATNDLVNRFRQDKGIQVIELDASPFSAIPILKHLRKNGIVAMIGDKDFFGNGQFISFFGRPVRFPIGPATIAMASGAALIPAFVFKRPDGRYFGILEDALPITREGSRDQAIQENLEKIARVFETYIRRYPDQWYHPDPIMQSQENVPIE